MQPKKRSSTRKSRSQLDRLARERADEQARCIPWQRLLDTRNEYIDWQEFYLWGRSILEVENHIPDWLLDILNDRCLGFCENEKRLMPKAAKNRPLALRLEEWIDEHIFGFAKQEGWFNAITFYAIREPRYQRAEVCWSQCVERWKKAKPLRYPSFEEWKDMAAGCDETAHLLPEIRAVMEPTKRVAPDRLAEAVSRYIDWEALGYWARPVLERESELPEDVAHELAQRCPVFLGVQSGARDWQRFMWWIADHYFDDAKGGTSVIAMSLPACAGLYVRGLPLEGPPGKGPRARRFFVPPCIPLLHAMMNIISCWIRFSTSFVQQ